MLSDLSRAQHHYDRTHIHAIDYAHDLSLHSYLDDDQIYTCYCFFSLCGQWLPSFYFAFGDVDCGCCLAADHLLLHSIIGVTMTYRIKAAFLLGTGEQPEYEHLTQKQAIQAGNKLRDQAQANGWSVEGPFTTAPQILAATKDGLTRYLTIDNE